ncbi:DUF4241 domain-containing protein [Kitasatospora sp. NPDC051853]|uniref:DUF4241 domain-containing protein n=1 Tax=Kitasatospora sp. NPDC051853 TaxID=3364058 RepID=UPI0037BCF411
MTAGSGTTVEVGYHEGWDPVARAGVGRLPEAEARRRDGAGEPYAALLTVHRRPKALFLVDWRHGYLGLFLLDGAARRDREYEYRQLEPGRLHLRRYQEWRHASDSGPEHPEGGRCFTVTVRPDGRATVVLAGDGSMSVRAEVPAGHRSAAKAEFGAWTAYADATLLGLRGPVDLVPAPWDAPAPAAPAAPGWAAPRPLAPRHLEALFTPGSRLADEEERVAVVTEPEPVGLLHLPSGAVTAADPGTTGEHEDPFTVTVPPGDYPVLIATMRWEGEDWGETPAAMLRITDRPTSTWELALRPDQDGRLLGAGQYYGFGVDTAMGCFLDATGRATLPELFHQQHRDPGLWGEGAPAAVEVQDPATGTNLIAYASGTGDGCYPVWIGRDADGAVTCFVADMLVLHHADALPPTVPSPAVTVLPYTPVADDRREAPFTSPGGTAGFLAARIAEVVEAEAEAARRRCLP